MMKTLLVTGFACDEVAWENLFPPSQSDFFHLTFAEQLKRAKKGDLRQLARVASQVIAEFKPELLVLHDFGLTSGLLGLLRAQKKDSSLAPRIIFFDGAMRGFDIFETPHPFWMQMMSSAQIKEGVLRAGGSFDENLLAFISEIKAIYRQVIAVSLKEKLDSFLRKKTSQTWRVRAPSLIIASPNDLYTTPICLKFLSEDLEPEAKFVQIPYGHFPYSIDPSPIREAMRLFLEQTTV